jgi:hypothetical protein
MVELADSVMVGYASPGGNLERLIREIEKKEVEYLVAH